MSVVNLCIGFWRRIRRQLNNESGETLVETLVSILIGTLALILLANAITTAKNIVTTSEKAMDEHYTAEDKLASEDSSAVVGSNFSVALSDTGGKVASDTTGVTVYANDLENLESATVTARYKK